MEQTIWFSTIDGCTEITHNWTKDMINSYIISFPIKDGWKDFHYEKKVLPDGKTYMVGKMTEPIKGEEMDLFYMLQETYEQIYKLSFLNVFESVFDTELSLLEKSLLLRVICVAKDKKCCSDTLNSLCKKLSCDIKTLRKARKNLEEKGLIGIERENGKVDIIHPLMENINKFVGCEIFK